MVKEINMLQVQFGDDFRLMYTGIIRCIRFLFNVSTLVFFKVVDRYSLLLEQHQCSFFVHMITNYIPRCSGKHKTNTESCAKEGFITIIDKAQPLP